MAFKRFISALFFCFFLLFLGIVGRGNLWAQNKKLTNIDKLYLTSIKLNAVCDDKKDIVRFLDISFVGSNFLAALLSNFHRANTHVEISQGLFINELQDYRKKIYYDPTWVYFENNFNLDQLNDADREIIRRKADTDYELVLNLNTSLWEQKITGYYTIYQKGVKLHSGKLKAISTYIIKDKGSPYISVYDDQIEYFLDPLDHRGEIGKIYSELGQEIGNGIRSLFIAEIKVKKKNKKRKPKKKKKRRTAEQIKFWDLMKPQY